MALAAFSELLRIAEAQLDAARTVDGAALGALNEERRQLQATLDTTGLEELSAAERAELREVAARIRAADDRTRACGENVLALLATLLPDTVPATYGRRGELRGF